MTTGTRRARYKQPRISNNFHRRLRDLLRGSAGAIVPGRAAPSSERLISWMTQA
jgi:hypothetical protein